MIDSVYIKMSQTAQEIQEAWKPKPGDLITHKYNLSTLISGVQPLTKEIYESHDLSDFDWIPRQEDLQEIAKKQLNIQISMQLFERFMKWLFIFTSTKMDYPTCEIKNEFRYSYRDGTNSYRSITEAWLCFVMETCFNKKWDTVKEVWVEL